MAEKYNNNITTEDINEATIDQERIIIEEAPLDEDLSKNDTNIQDSSDITPEISFNEFINQLREKYLDQNIKEDEWRIHRLFLYCGNEIGLSVNELSSIASYEFDTKQKEILIFLLFANFFNKETFIKEFLDSTISAETMLVKIPMLINEEKLSNSKQLFDDAVQLYKDSLEEYIKEKEHFEEQYIKLNESYRNLNAECISYRNENENLKKEYDSLVEQIDELKSQLAEKDSVVNDLRTEKNAKDEMVESTRKEEENKRKIEERAEELARDIIAKEEAKRMEKESIEKAAVERYKQEHSIKEKESSGISEEKKKYLNMIAMQQMQNNMSGIKDSKEKKGLFKRKKKSSPEEKSFYGYDLETCLINARLNSSQMSIITYAIDHDIDEHILVNAINNNCDEERLKAIVEYQMAQRMKLNKQKEQEERQRHQQEINDYGTYTQEDVKYGE